MKKKYIAGILCVLMLVSIPLTAAQTHKKLSSEIINKEPQSIIGVTFIAGIIINTQSIGNHVQGKALILVYYDRGLIFKNSGLSIGYKTVRFKDGDFLYMSEPNQLGLIQVAGLCTGFSIQK